MQRKTALVSGASGNLGRAVTEYFLQKDRSVAGLVHHASNQDKPEENYLESIVDLTNKHQAASVILEIMEKFKNIDTAIFTTGGFAMGNIESTTIEDIHKLYHLNFETAYNLAQPILKVMKKQGTGSLFFIGSGQGLDTTKGAPVVAYSLSKSLLFQLANIINADTREKNIKAFVVVPDIIDTPQNRESMPNADFSKWQKPEAIAGIIGRYAENPQQFAHTTIVVKDEL